METKRVETGQAVLFAASQRTYIVLAAIGESAIALSSEYGPHLEDCCFNRHGLPTQPGLYVWEGEIRETGGWVVSDLIVADIRWIGEHRPASVADLRRFGMAGEAMIQFPVIEAPATAEMKEFAFQVFHFGSYACGVIVFISGALVGIALLIEYTLVRYLRATDLFGEFIRFVRQRAISRSKSESETQQ